VPAGIAVRQLRSAGAEQDFEGEEIQQLRKQLSAEQVRAEIAGYASLTAIRNATKEGAERKVAEAALARLQPSLTAAHASLAKAQQTVANLEAQLALARKRASGAQSAAQTNSPGASAASTQIAEAHAAQEKAEAEAKVSEAKEAQEEQALQAVKKATTFAQKEAILKAADAAADRREAQPQSSVGDFALFGFLRTCPYQPILALVFGIAGLGSILDGVRFFEFFFISVFAAVVATCVCAESSNFGSDTGLLENVVVGTEAALVTAIACYYGMEGFQIVVGALLGLVMAHWTCGLFIVDSPENRSSEVVWYAVLALVGAVSLFFGKKHAHGVVGPFAGGLLCSSFAVYFASAVASHSATSTEFLDFVEAMLNVRSATAVFGKQGVVAWQVGACVWMVVFGLGTSRHFFDWPQLTRRDSKSRSKRSSRSDRAEPLLPRPGRPGSPSRYDEDPPASRRDGKSSGRPSGRSKDVEPRMSNLSRTSYVDQYKMYGEVGTANVQTPNSWLQALSNRSFGGRS